jgi:hypothetical protein
MRKSFGLTIVVLKFVGHYFKCQCFCAFDGLFSRLALDEDAW